LLEKFIDDFEHVLFGEEFAKPISYPAVDLIESGY